MKRLTLLSLLIATLFGAVSCNDNNDAIYVSTSGNGGLTIDYDPPIYLYRMVIFSTETQQDVYLLGNTAYVDAEGEFKGRGAAVKFTLPNEADNYLLKAQSFEIDQSDYMVSYSNYINYLADEDDSDFTPLASGTVIIRKAGQLYDIRLLGNDSEGDDILISYKGYIYRAFYDDNQEEQRLTQMMKTE